MPKKKTKAKPKRKPSKAVRTRKPATAKRKLPTDIDALESAFDGDKEMALFFLSWLKNGRNATRAYSELHPKVNARVAAVLGSRKLRKVDISMILDSYGISVGDYFIQLKEGLNAMKQVEGVLVGANGIQKAFTEIPDHRTRRVYHKALGEILRIERNESNVVNVANQINNSNSIDNISDDELDELVS